MKRSETRRQMKREQKKLHKFEQFSNDILTYDFFIKHKFEQIR